MVVLVACYPRVLSQETYGNASACHSPPLRLPRGGESGSPTGPPIETRKISNDRTGFAKLLAWTVHQ